LLAAWVWPVNARAETVLERAARTGVITMGGRTDLVPYSFVDGKGQLVGLSIDVAERIAAEASTYLNRPVRLAFTAAPDANTLFKQVHTGETDLACGVQFTWEREMFVDYSIPFSLSGIRLLTRSGGLDGTAASLQGKRIGVLAGSLGDATIKSYAPPAVRVPLTEIDAAVAALQAGRVDALAGDSILLAGAVAKTGAKGLALVPGVGLQRYAVGCIIPENNSTFRNLMNLAIAKLLQGYINGNREATESVNRWLGPSGILELPPQVIKDYFQMVLLTNEQIRVPADTTPEAKP